jgi:hypothetical protein
MKDVFAVFVELGRELWKTNRPHACLLLIALCLVFTRVGIETRNAIMSNGKELVPLQYDRHWWGEVKHYREAKTGRCYRRDPILFNEEPCK